MMKDNNLRKANQETRHIWDVNADYWDEYMGEGNDFVDLLCWPAIERLLDVHPGEHILDIACGNGLTSRRLAKLGFEVEAFDFSTAMIEKAIKRTDEFNDKIHYQVLDATSETDLLNLGEGEFEGAISNLALFDMAEIDPLFRALAQLLRPGGCFVFSVLHPCFNGPYSALMAETEDRSGRVITEYAVKVKKYITTSMEYSVALPDQPELQLIFHRPIQALLAAGFSTGFVLDGFEERTFPSDQPHSRSQVSWGSNFSEIPPVLVARMRLSAD